MIIMKILKSQAADSSFMNVCSIFLRYIIEKKWIRLQRKINKLNLHTCCFFHHIYLIAKKQIRSCVYYILKTKGRKFFLLSFNKGIKEILFTTYVQTAANEIFAMSESAYKLYRKFVYGTPSSGVCINLLKMKFFRMY